MPLRLLPLIKQGWKKTTNHHYFGHIYEAHTLPEARKLSNMYKQQRVTLVGMAEARVNGRGRKHNITKEEEEILMKAEALVGTVLGTCTLQQLIGQGGMGAVYLAQQSRPRRQVAVKVLLPSTTLKPQHLAAFLERFRRETDAAASLEHPNIMPVYEYGERDGLAYLVMPYISGGTLRDVMEREGTLAFPKIVNYLEQMGAALDFAHARGVIHRDIKPANILITPEGRLLLTDFGLVKILSDGQGAQVRLTGAGAPVGTPDYMSPEQVMGTEVDGRADQYSLGIILYQMVTGTTPFQGETPMQIAAQQLHTQPTLPRTFRPELPEAAEQVLLKSMAKRPGDRYTTALAFATAFRLALQDAGVQQQPVQPGTFAASGFSTTSALPARGLFDPKWQTGALQSMTNEQQTGTGTGALPIPNMPIRTSGLLSRTGMFPSVGKSTGMLPTALVDDRNPNTPGSVMPAPSVTRQLDNQPTFNQMSPSFNTMTDSGMQPNVMPQFNQMSPSLKTTTGALNVPNAEQSGTGTIKLTGPVKVVQVPVAGQPGQYVTGLLPVPTAIQASPQPAPSARSQMVQKIAMAFALVILLVGGTTGVWYMRTHSAQTTSHSNSTSPGVASTPNVEATVLAQATATAQSHIILADPLSSNIRNFPESTGGTKIYQFKDGAYHMTNLGDSGIAVVLQESLPKGPIGYTLTMEEIKGDDTSTDNSFGMILRYSQKTQGNQSINTFYSFEVFNYNGGQYRFYKYDNSKGSTINPWTQLWSQAFGHEFRQGHGARSINTVRVFASGNTFTFTINGKTVGSVKDGSFSSGTVGMLVNLKGTEVAFSNMLITNN
jgi:serine/threonine protein kinase